MLLLVGIDATLLGTVLDRIEDQVVAVLGYEGDYMM